MFRVRMDEARRRSPLLHAGIGLIALAVQGCGGGGDGGGTGSSTPVATVQISPAALQFGNQLVGTSSALQTVTVSNPGTAALSISSVALSESGGAFNLSNACGAVLAAGASCTLGIAFSPVTAGPASATLTVQSNAASDPSVALSGTATAPLVSVDSTALNFVNQVIGAASPPQTIAISNAGTAALEIGGVSLGGPNAANFAVSDSCASPLPPGGSCAATITFTPTSAAASAAVVKITSNAATSPAITLSGSGLLPFAPFAASDPSVILDVGIAALHPRNTWTALPSGFALGQVTGLTPGTVIDTTGFTPNSGGYIANYSAFPGVASTQGTLYMRLQRAALSVQNSTDPASAFFDSVGNTTGGYGAQAATAFTVYDGSNNILQWTMGPQSNSAQIFDAGNWIYPGARLGNSHGSPNLDTTYADIVFTWQGTTYWSYFDGVPVGFGTFATPLPASGQFSQIVIGGYLSGTGSVGQPLGPFVIQRFQISTRFSAPPMLNGEPLIGFYGDSFVVQGAGVSEDVPGPPGSPTIAQVNAVQAQMNPATSPNAYSGTFGQDGFISRAQAYSLRQHGGYLQFYTAAQSGHGWAYTGMGGTTAANTPAIDDFSVGKTGYSDALNAAEPAYIFAFGSVNDVNNGVPTNLVGDMQAHFDYWANNNPKLLGIYFVETLSWELAVGACTARGGPAGWRAQMTLERNQMRAAFKSGFLAGTRKVPVTYIETYESWVQGPNSARFLIASNPDNHTQSSDTGSMPNGHPDAEGNIQIADAYVWPYISKLLR